MYLERQPVCSLQRHRKTPLASGPKRREYEIPIPDLHLQTNHLPCQGAQVAPAVQENSPDRSRLR